MGSQWEATGHLLSSAIGPPSPASKLCLSASSAAAQGPSPMGSQ